MATIAIARVGALPGRAPGQEHRPAPQGGDGDYGPLRLTGYSRLSSAGLAMAFVSTKAQRKLVIHLRVDAGTGHPITDLDISDLR
jgi:hypothetical protein